MLAQLPLAPLALALTCPNLSARLCHYEANIHLLEQRKGIVANDVLSYEDLEPADRLSVGCKLIDASEVMAEVKLHKSPAEIEVVVEAGRIAQIGMLAELRKNPASTFVRGLVEDLQW